MSDLPTVTISEGGIHESGEIEYPVMSAEWIEWGSVRTEFSGGAGVYALVRVDAMEKVWWCEPHRATGLGGAMPGGVTVANPSPWCWWADEAQVPSVARECDMSQRWLVKGADDGTA